ncbi:autotransporter outer membrane beta-barrel domain-containing protein [Polaromonas sp. UC242_47]|uniref:autotransporter outer membrane beta-barrel domain-containing protein n=1 Tax=Polaromonas sp. UC242_47 TaxID=3374626 RepID=UPI00379FBE06
MIAVTAASVSAYAIRNTAGATIGTIRNVNGILSSVGGYSIRNLGNLTTLINGQGGNVTALTYSGKLPVNYSIALGSTAASYGQMAATGVTASASGPMRFGIDSGAVQAKTYTSVLSGISAPLLNSGTLTGKYMGQTWLLVQNGAGIWDLLFPDFGQLGIEVPGAVGPVFSVYKASASLSNSPSYGAARAIDGHANLQALFTGLVGDQAVSNAVSQTLPLLTGGSMVSANAALTGVNGVVQARIEASRGLSSGDEQVSGKHFWIKPFGSWARQGDVSGVSGYKASTSGLAAGLDDTFSDKTRLGLAFAYANSGVDSNSATVPQRSSVDVYQFIAYGSHSLDETTNLNFQVDAGLNRNNARRTIGFMSSVASANYSSVSTHAGVGLGQVFQLSDKTVFTPSVRADYTWIKDSAYEESGAGLLNLAVGKRSSDQMILAVDGKLSHQLNSSTALTANAGVGYDALNRQSSITAAFAGAPGASFVTYGLTQDPWIGRVGAGLVQKLSSGVELTARYDAEFRNHFLNQTASLKLRWNF